MTTHRKGEPEKEVNLKPTELVVREQLERILSASSFKSSERRRNFLRYVVEETLAGRKERMKGYNIAVSVFDRAEDFDAGSDPVVRLEARRLRRELEHYYLTGGRGDPVVITIPKGAYVPVFEHQEATPLMSGDARPTVPPLPAERQSGRYPPASLWTAAAIIIVLAVSGTLALQRYYSFPAETPTETIKSNWDGIPVIAILPFNSIEGSPPAQEAALDLAQDIITDLSRVQPLRVIAYSSTSQVSGTADDLETIGKKLGATHVLRGRLQVMPEKYRLNASLVEVESKRQIWAERFDYKMAERFEVQTRIAHDIASSLSIKLLPVSIETGRFASRDLQALYQQALTLVHPPSDPARVSASRTLMEQFIDRAPDHPHGYGGLAFIESHSIWYGHTENTPEAHAKIRRLATKGLSIDPGNVRALVGLSISAMISGNSESSIEFARRAVAAQPSSSYANAYLGVALIFAERPSEAFQPIYTAMQLDPANSRRPYLNILAVAKFHAGNYKDSISAFQKGIERRGPYGPTMMAYHAASHFALKQEEKGRAVLVLLSEKTSGPGSFTVEGWLRRATRRDDYIKPLLDVIEKARRLD